MGAQRERRARRGDAGGIVSSAEIDIAATLALRGLPALRYLTTQNDHERVTLMAVAVRAQKLHEIDQRNLAIAIIDTLAKAMRRG
jgi:hypothetical protein